MFEELEPRLLLSADWNAVLGDPAPLEEPAIVQFASLPATNDPAASATATQRKELVVIDTRVPDYAALVNDFLSQTTGDRGFDILVLNERDDGITRVSSALASGERYAAVHLISHGADGSVQLGGTTIDAASLVERARGFQTWASGLSADADILIYGCNVAATEQGQALITGLSNLTGADVAASEDKTGAAALGGDWDLEYRSGNANTAVALTGSFRQEWNGLLIAYTVTNTNDAGVGSLRDAINLTNLSAGIMDTINFNIAGAGPHTINLASALPAITDAVVIDGTTEPDFAGTPIIELNGASAGLGVSGLTIATNNSTIRGLIVNRFDANGIQVSGDNNLIAGNWIGIDSTGTADAGNGVDGITISGNNNTIGGTTSADRNVLSGNDDEGVDVDPGFTGNVIIGNWIGTNGTNSGTIANGVFGAGLDGGVRLDGDNNRLGGTGVNEGNVIRGNWNMGVLVNGLNNQILGNSIYGNELLGIDLAEDGLTANDLDDGDAGPNDLQNFPVLSSAVTSGGNTTITGTLNSTSSTTFRIEFFSSPTGDASGYGEGQTYLGFQNVTTGMMMGGNATINVTLTGVSVIAGHQVTATATRLSGGIPVSTSEFAQNVAATFVNTPPVITSNGGGASASVNVAENTTPVTTVTATDADMPPQTLSYSITGGADAARFTIDGSTGALSFITAPDYEAPTDAGANNVYNVAVSVSDGSGGTDTQAIAVTVANVNEAPVITSDGGGATAAISVAENAAAVTTVTSTDVDGGAPSYSLAGGADQARFTINPATGALTFNVAPDFEAPADTGANNVYDVIVQVSDGNGGADTQTISISVTAVNDNAPVITSDGGGANASVNVSENNTAVTTVTATDTDLPAQTLTYSVVSGADQALFQINAATGALRFNVAPDFENPLDADADNVYDVWVLVNDNVGAIDWQVIAVTVTDTSDLPIGAVSDSDATANAVNENAAIGTTVGVTALAIDPDTVDTVSYTLDDNAGGRFGINSASGAVTVANSGLLDRESAATHNIVVRATSSDGSFSTRTFAINVNDVDEFDVGLVSDTNASPNAVNENAANGTAVGITAFAEDADATINAITYTLDDNAGGRFAIDGATGMVTVANGTLLDREAAASHMIVVRAASADGSFRTQGFTISVNPVNDNAPVITSDGGGASASFNVSENSTAVTTVTATDTDLPAQTLTYAIAGGADQALFTINPTTGALAFNAAPNFEAPADTGADNVYEVIVQVSDGTFADLQQISITVTDTNEAPAGSNGSVTTGEDTAYAFSVGDFGFTDADAGDALSAVRIVSLPAAGTLTLSGTAVNVNDVIAVADIVAGNLGFTPALNGSGSPYANFDFSVRDAGGLYAAAPATLTINVMPTNDPPVANDDSFSIAEDGALTIAAPGVLANDSDADGDALGIVSYTNAANGNVLANPDGSFTYAPNANFTGTDTFSYTGSDGNGGLATATVTITVTAVNDAPVLAANNGMFLNNTATGTVTAAQLGVSDVDNTSAQTVYTLTAVPASGVLRLDGVVLGVNDTFTQADIDANRLSYEHLDLATANAAFSFTVTDGAGGAIAANSFAITVTFSASGAGGPETPPASDPGDVPPPAITPVDPLPEPIGGLPDEESLVRGGHGSGGIAPRAAPHALRTAVQAVEDREQSGTAGAYTRDAALEQPVSRRLGEVLDVMRRHAGSDEPAGRHATLIVKSVQASSLVLTAGFVSWLLRSGALATSLVATTPAWKGFDPLPILACRDKEKEGDDVQTRLDAVRDREEREARRFFNHGSGGRQA